MTAASPGHADEAAFINWFVSQGHVVGCFPEDYSRDAFFAGLQTARDLAAREPHAAPGDGNVAVAEARERADQLMMLLDEATSFMAGYGDRPALVSVAIDIRQRAGLEA